MDVRGSFGKRQYPAVVYLVTWVSNRDVWPYFDGWCASRSVDHLDLPWDRWLNLVYYFAVRNASAEDKKKIDNDIQDRITAWNLAKVMPVIEQARTTPETKPGQRQRRMPPKPSGWGDDTRTTFDNKAAIKTLTAGGVSGKARRK